MKGYKLGRKAVSEIMFILLTIGMLSLTFNIQPAKAEWTGTVYIRADGSIEPPDAPIITYDNVTYTLTDNITSSADGIVVERDNIVVDGAGRMLEGIGIGTGIDLSNRNNVTVKNMEIKGFQNGIHLEFSSHVTLRNNTMTENTYNLVVYGWDLSYLIHDIDSSNTVDGKKIYYWIHKRDVAVPLDAGYVALVNCTNITARDLNLTNNGQGLLLVYTTNSTITKNKIATHGEGIRLHWSSNNSIVGNEITNSWCGIELWDSSNNNSIVGNNIVNGTNGVSLLDHSNYNSIIENSIANNEVGIGLCYCSNYNSVVRNKITNNAHTAIWLEGSCNNTISGNKITNNERGIVLAFYSSNNIVYHNNFIDNEMQASLYKSYNNVWDDGYPSGGNYWSDYTGVDYYSGPYRNETGSDGIGDSLYIVDENNIDHYPLMGPFNSFNASVGYSVNVISNSTVEDFRYFESNSTIIMHVSNVTANQTIGFCRLTIPHNVMSPPYTVKVNGTTIEYQTIYENHTEGISIIYFTYEHSKLGITIIPEFPSVITLMLMLMVTSIIASVKRKVLRRKFPT